jgi:hypothetical protein
LHTSRDAGASAWPAPPGQPLLSEVLPLSRHHARLMGAVARPDTCVHATEPPLGNPTKTVPSRSCTRRTYASPPRSALAAFVRTNAHCRACFPPRAQTKPSCDPTRVAAFASPLSEPCRTTLSLPPGALLSPCHRARSGALPLMAGTHARALDQAAAFAHLAQVWRAHLRDRVVLMLTVYFGTPNMFITLWLGSVYRCNLPLGTLII